MTHNEKSIANLHERIAARLVRLEFSVYLIVGFLAGAGIKEFFIGG